MKYKNIEEGRELARTYAKISLKDISEANQEIELEPFDIGLDDEFQYSDYAYNIMESLTGFGTWKCPICNAVKHDCEECFHSENSFDSVPCTDSPTYHNIDRAKTPRELLQALKERAIYIEELISKIEKK